MLCVVSLFFSFSPVNRGNKGRWSKGVKGRAVPLAQEEGGKGESSHIILSFVENSECYKVSRRQSTEV